jgi:hypothetical protein
VNELNKRPYIALDKLLMHRFTPRNAIFPRLIAELV